MLDSERQLLLGPKPLHKSSWSNMIQHYSGCIYFSTVQVNMNYSCLESWIHGIFYTPRISLRAFLPRELSGSLDDWASRGLNKNGSSQTHRRNRFQVVNLQQFEIELIGALLPTWVHLAWSRMYVLWSYWSWWHGTRNYTNTKASPGTWNYNKNTSMNTDNVCLVLVGRFENHSPIEEWCISCVWIFCLS